MVAEDWETIPMFEVPKKYRPPRKPDNWPRWRAYKGKRTSCDDCIKDIAQGTWRFVAQPATWVREDQQGRRYFCARHTIERKKGDASHEDATDG